MATAIFMVTWLLFIIVFQSFVLGGWFILLWIFIAPLISSLVMVLFVALNVLLLRKRPYDDKYRYYFTRSVAHLVNVFITNIEIKAVGLENIPEDGPLVGFANHKSYIDPFIVVSAITRPNSFTPKEGLYKIPILKQWIVQLGSMKVSRTDNRETLKEMRQAIKRIEAGYFLSVFPEGGRRDRNTDKIINFLPGAFKMAEKSEADILPISIRGNSVIGSNSPFRKTKVTIIFHPVIKYVDYQNLKTSEIGKIVQEQINSVL